MCCNMDVSESNWFTLNSFKAINFLMVIINQLMRKYFLYYYLREIIYSGYALYRRIFKCETYTWKLNHVFVLPVRKCTNHLYLEYSFNNPLLGGYTLFACCSCFDVCNLIFLNLSLCFCCESRLQWLTYSRTFSYNVTCKSCNDWHLIS